MPVKRHIRLPPMRRRPSAGDRACLGLLGALCGPFYLARARWHRLPGLGLRGRFARLGFRALMQRSVRVPLSVVYNMFFFPMDSTRHFEFDFMWRSLRRMPIGTYLDVSSPRLFPLLLIAERAAAAATLLNPDRRDLEQTRVLVRALGFGDRCSLVGELLDAARLPANHFDVITCMSVLEHIPDDRQAVMRMWDSLRPGGRLLLSVPCAAVAEEQYLDAPVYEFLKPDPEGFVFHQYLYDEPRLEERVYSVTGRPVAFEVYGEKHAGRHLEVYKRKWTDLRYPFWKEPWFMSTAFQRFDSIATLPGEGVALLEFVK